MFNSKFTPTIRTGSETKGDGKIHDEGLAEASGDRCDGHCEGLSRDVVGDILLVDQPPFGGKYGKTMAYWRVLGTFDVVRLGEERPRNCRTMMLEPTGLAAKFGHMTQMRTARVWSLGHLQSCSELEAITPRPLPQPRELAQRSPCKYTRRLSSALPPARIEHHCRKTHR